MQPTERHRTLGVQLTEGENAVDKSLSNFNTAALHTSAHQFP